jgi:hypothetical protein
MMRFYTKQIISLNISYITVPSANTAERITREVMQALAPIATNTKALSTHVVEVLARPDFVDDALRMQIGHCVLAKVPPAKAEIDPADEGSMVINHHEFLVVGLLCLEGSCKMFG